MNSIRPWTTRLVVVLSLIAGVVYIAVDSTTAASSIPNPPVFVSASPSPTSTSVAVSWTFSSSGAQPDRALVIAYLGTTNVGQVTCTAPLCSSTQIPGLTVGDSYTFDVEAGVASGYSAATASNAVTVQSGCATANVCVGVDATNPGAPADHVASGFLQGVVNTTPASLVAPLDVQMWRTAVGPPDCSSGDCVGYNGYNQMKALAPSASMMSILSDNWYGDTYEAYRECPNMIQCGLEHQETPRGGAATPWTNWPYYDAFIKSVVEDVNANSATVNYWDLINEPPAQSNLNDQYFDYNDSATITASDIEQWFLHTYDDVISVDPTAGIVCPSFEGYQDYPGEVATTGELVDFSTFLAFAAANGINCTAFSWHEINTVGAPTDFNAQPQDIQAHVTRFRALLAQYPQFENAKIIINEYTGFDAAGTGVSEQQLPGWTAGYIAALEAAGVNGAVHSCTPTSGCVGNFDDLFVPSGSTVAPSDTYWPYWFYAQMNGNQLPVTSSAEQVSAFSTLDSSTNTIRILLGRHETPGASGVLTTENVTMSVNLPASFTASTVNVGTQLYADNGGAVTEPAITTTTVPVVNGVATISLPSVGGQNAYGITLTPSGQAIPVGSPPVTAPPPTTTTTTTTAVPPATSTAPPKNLLSWLEDLA